MENTQLKFALILKWFFIFIILETVILLKIINGDLFLFKILVNYLFLFSIIPLIIEKIHKGRIEFFSPFVIFSVSYLLLFGITALDLLIFRSDVIRKDEKFYTLALFYSILGLHFFQFGYFSRLGYSFLNRKKNIPYNWSKTKFKIILIVYSLISILSFLIILQLSGDISYYFNNIHSAMVNITTGSAIFFMSVLLIKIPLLIWFYYKLENNRFSFAFLLFFVVVIFLLISLGERGPFMFLIVSMLVCFHYSRKSLKILQIFMITIILVLFLVIYGQYREFTNQGYKLKKAGFNIKFGIEVTYHNIMSNFDQLERLKDIIKYVPEKLDFKYGKTFLNLLLKPIPSRIWEGKPQGAGVIVTESLYPKHFAAKVSFAPSVVGELYLNFHVLGVISGMFVFGLVSKGLYLLLEKNYRNRNFIIVYAFILPEIFGQIRGDFAVVNSYLIFQLFFLLFALNYIKVKSILIKND